MHLRTATFAVIPWLPAQLAYLLREHCISFTSLVQWYVATGLNNEVALLTKINKMENTFGLAGPGHYNEVASLLKWPISEVSLYVLHRHAYPHISYLLYPYIMTSKMRFIVIQTSFISRLNIIP